MNHAEADDPGPESAGMERPHRLYSAELPTALAWAAELHSGQTRKGKSEPYLTHLLTVAVLILRFGGSETQAIAGLLHDAPEDCGGQPVLDEIRRRFGESVADIVEDCSDSLTENADAKAPWRERKLTHLQHAADLSEESALVAVCDKIANLQDIVADYLRDGEDTFTRFRGGPIGTRAYYRAMFHLLEPAVPGEATEVFRDLLGRVDSHPLDPSVDPIQEFADRTVGQATGGGNDARGA